MSDEMKPILNKVADGIALTADEAEDAFGVIMSGDATAAQIAGFLMHCGFAARPSTRLRAPSAPCGQK
jgi:anthranilate phosphoribosyltransferase